MPVGEIPGQLPPEVARVIEDENRRAVLRGLAAQSTETDADFDRLTALAAGIMRAPIALVSLVDVDRQWFRSRIGLDLDGTTTDVSFCAHTIAEPDGTPMVVEDASGDPRFARNALVTGDPYIRFYAGAPIVVAGARIGALCTIDREPRQRPGASELKQLEALAALAASLFQLKDSSRRGGLAREALFREEKRHALALEAASIASWVWDVRTDIVECDALLPVLLNLPQASRITAREVFRAVDPRDVAKTEVQLRDSLRSGDDYYGEYRIGGVRPERWLAARGRVVERDGEGNPTLVFGVNFDITERRSSEERQRLLLREINHRVKNTLATVQALASQTVRHARNPNEFLEAFSGRLQAVGRIHGLLSDNEWQGIGLRDLIHMQAHPVQRRIALSGDDVFLTPDQALGIGLVLHELVNNALNHGALSVANGGVDLSWREIGTGETTRLTLIWQEAGGPPVSTPQHRGFGSILINRALDKILSSSVKHEFLPNGVRAELTIPLDVGADVQI